jgi:hypothetical protein
MRHDASVHQPAPFMTRERKSRKTVPKSPLSCPMIYFATSEELLSSSISHYVGW